MNYREFLGAVSGIIYRVDPMGLSGAPADEYDLEAQLILAALAKAQDKQALRGSIDSVFKKWFDAALNDETLDDLADNIWSLWESEHREISP